MAEPVLSIRDLSISFDLPEVSFNALRGVSLHVDRGECLALVGESGCGKTLVALTVLGLVPPPGLVDGGMVKILGNDVGASADKAFRGRDAGMIFQEPLTSLNPVFSVKKHLEEALTSHGKRPKGEVAARSLELLREVGIPDPERRLSAYPHELSGGLRQRVMIACAIAMNPALLIADEPTTALDVTVEAQIMRLLDRLRVERGMGVLFVTHDLGLVAQHADRVAVMYAGQIVEEATVEDLFCEPLHPYTRALLAAMPKGLGGEILKPIPGNVPHPSRLLSGCAFRDRCALAVVACTRSIPDLSDISPCRKVRCFRAGEHHA